LRRTRNTEQENAALFAALGDEVRLRLVFRLCDEGPLSIVRLTAGATVTRQAIAKHLAAEGASVVVNYASSKAGADKVVEEIKANGGKAIAVQADGKIVLRRECLGGGRNDAGR
jgi:DNA-binding transcriptional ArsR family regulator